MVEVVLAGLGFVPLLRLVGGAGQRLTGNPWQRRQSR